LTAELEAAAVKLRRDRRLRRLRLAQQQHQQQQQLSAGRRRAFSSSTSDAVETHTQHSDRFIASYTSQSASKQNVDLTCFPLFNIPSLKIVSSIGVYLN